MHRSVFKQTPKYFKLFNKIGLIIIPNVSLVQSLLVLLYFNTNNESFYSAKCCIIFWDLQLCLHCLLQSNFSLLTNLLLIAMPPCVNNQTCYPAKRCNFKYFILLLYLSICLLKLGQTGQKKNNKKI